MAVYTDQMGYEVTVPQFPKRIVSLVPSLTELLADLGLEDQVVGLTHFCVYPEALYQNRTRIGGTKKAQIQKLKALSPDLVIANKEENEKAQVDEIKTFCPVWVSHVYDLPSAMDMIRRLSKVVGQSEAGTAMADRIQSKLDDLVKAPPLQTLYMIWRKPYMAAGGDTFIHEMMKQMGLENVLADQLRYPQLSTADIQAKAPDLILLSSEPYPFKTKHMEALQPLVPQAKIRLVDGSMFSWYGSRIEKAVEYLQALSTELKGKQWSASLPS